MTQHTPSKLALLDVYQRNLTVISLSNHEIIQSISNIGHPDGLQVDTENGYFYWTDMGEDRSGEDFFSADGAIWRSDLAGNNITKIAGNGAFYTPKQIQLDQQAQKLYWCNREGGRVMSANVDGSNLSTLIERGKGEPYPKHKEDQCVGITLDKKAGLIYWTQKGPKKGGLGRIFRAALTTAEDQLPWERTDVVTLLENLPEPIDLEIDAKGEYLYWSDRGAEPDGNSLNRAHVTAEGLADAEVLVRGFKETIGLVLDESNNAAYVSDLSGTVYHIDLKTFEKTVIYDQGTAVTGMALF